MLDYFRLANPFFVDFFLKKITNNVLHRELKKNAPYPLPLLLNLTIAGYGLQVTEVCATYGTTDTQEILLQMENSSFHLMRVLKKTLTPGNEWNVTSQYKITSSFLSIMDIPL